MQCLSQWFGSGVVLLQRLVIGEKQVSTICLWYRPRISCSSFVKKPVYDGAGMQKSFKLETFSQALQNFNNR